MYINNTLTILEKQKKNYHSKGRTRIHTSYIYIENRQGYFNFII